MSAEENILIPKARYEKLLARIAEESKKSAEGLKKTADARPTQPVEAISSPTHTNDEERRDADPPGEHPGEMVPEETQHTPPNGDGRSWEEILSNHRDFLPPGSATGEGVELTQQRPRKGKKSSKKKVPRIKKTATTPPPRKALKTTKTARPYLQLARKWLTVSRK